VAGAFANAELHHHQGHDPVPAAELVNAVGEGRSMAAALLVLIDQGKAQQGACSIVKAGEGKEANVW
jgi:hypothetical protein